MRTRGLRHPGPRNAWAGGQRRDLSRTLTCGASSRLWPTSPHTPTENPACKSEGGLSTRRRPLPGAPPASGGLQPAQQATGPRVSAAHRPPARKRLERGGQGAKASEQSCADPAPGLRREALPSGSST